MMRRLSGRVSKRFADFDRGDPTKMFELLTCLGEGTYGSVWSARDLKAGTTSAVKIVPIDNDLEEIKAEIAIMRDSKSDYIIKLFSAYVSSDASNIWMSMEVCEAGSVNDLMYITDEPLSLKELTDVTASAAMGLAYLHERFIIHRDIKCGNILLNAQGQCKLADFGVSAVLKSKEDRTTTAIGAPFWMAPECISELPYDGRADVWSLGITVIEMAESRPPNSHIHPMRALFIIPHQQPPTLSKPEEWPEKMVAFVTKCLTKNMDHRINSKALIKDPFISERCERLKKEKGRSAVLEDLVRKHLPKIEQFRDLDDDDGEDNAEEGGKYYSETDDDQLDSGTMMSEASSVASRKPPPARHGSLQTFYMLDEDQPPGVDSSDKSTRPASNVDPFDKLFQPKDRKSSERPASSIRGSTRAPSSRHVPSVRNPTRLSTSSFVEVSGGSAQNRAQSRRGAPILSERRLAPVRPVSAKKSTLKAKAQSLTETNKKRLSKRFSRSRLSSRKGSVNLGKMEQNRMSFQDVQNMLSSAPPQGRKQSVRNPVEGGAMVMTKGFIRLIKQSEKKAPELFAQLEGKEDAQEVLPALIHLLKLAVEVAGKEDSSSGSGKKEVSSSGSGASSEGKPKPKSRPPPPPPSPR